MKKQCQFFNQIIVNLILLKTKVYTISVLITSHKACFMIKLKKYAVELQSTPLIYYAIKYSIK